MTEPNKQLLMCQNGHPQTVSNSKFCIYCGKPFVQPQAKPVQNHAPVNQTPQLPPNQQPIPPQPPRQNPIPNAPVNQNFPPNKPPQNQPPQTPPNFAPQNLPPQPPYNFPPQNQQPNYQPQTPQFNVPPAQYVPQPPQHIIQSLDCYVCGGNGQGLSEKTVICKECGWLRPLVPGYQVDASAFAWAADGKAMAALRSMRPLNAAAKAVSEKVGRRWIESTFNGVLLGEKQLPHIYAQAIRAARILGMSHMPDVYLSGERSWDCLTFGSDKDSFVVIGSALAANFQGADMLFLLAREMGHCRAGHALWKTVIRFFLGEQGPGKGVMSNGIFNAIFNPTALIEGAIEMPLLAWARQAEITADRAGLLVVGEEEIARRVLLSWTLKSSFIYKQINIEAWLEQQEADDGGYSRLSELTTTSTPYIIPRLKLLAEFARSQELQYWRRAISNAIKQSAPPKPLTKQPPKSDAQPANQPKKAASDVIRLKCSKCETAMRVPLKAMAGKTELPVKCPNPKCGEITKLKKKINQAANQPKPKKREENLDYGD